jgi:Secretion system C-terminal sorting domain
MKKFILMAGILLCGIAQAQISVTGNNGQVIEDGYVYTTHSLLTQGKLNLHVTNTSEEPINLRLRIESMEGTTGQQTVQFCFGQQCYTNITVGKVVPNDAMHPNGLTLEPGASNSNEDHFWNFDPGNGSPIVVDLAFVQYDDNGTQIGDPLVSFTFRYEPTAGMSDFSALQNMGITLKNTVVNSQLELAASQNAKMEVYNMAGQLVKSEAITQGSYSADLSGLSAAVYIARFTNEENKSSQIRIVKN